MDWMPLLVGLIAGTGWAAVEKYVSPTGSLGKHRFLLYNGALIAIGVYGELEDHFSPDLRYGLIVSGTTLLAQDIPNALSGGGLGAFGDVAPAPADISIQVPANWSGAPSVAAGSILNVRTEEMRDRNLAASLLSPTAAG